MKRLIIKFVMLLMDGCIVVVASLLLPTWVLLRLLRSLLSALISELLILGTRLKKIWPLSTKSTLLRDLKEVPLTSITMQSPENTHSSVEEPIDDVDSWLEYSEFGATFPVFPNKAEKEKKDGQ